MFLQIYGVWGDENGTDGSKSMVGEASISLATACYGKSINGNSGHDETDVLYIAFPGSEAVPGANGAAWGASSYDAFEKSIQAKGDQLIQRLSGSGSGGGGSPTTTAGQPKPTCSWIGHCPGELPPLLRLHIHASSPDSLTDLKQATNVATRTTATRIGSARTANARLRVVVVKR